MSVRRFIIKSKESFESQKLNEIGKKIDEKIEQTYQDRNQKNNTVRLLVEGSSDALAKFTEIIKQEEFFIKEDLVIGL